VLDVTPHRPAGSEGLFSKQFIEETAFFFLCGRFLG
jgi:hypothetical protein